jgi:hypothetical protein
MVAMSEATTEHFPNRLKLGLAALRKKMGRMVKRIMGYTR